MEQHPVVYLISGPAAAKSVVARLLASRLEPSVHLDCAFVKEPAAAADAYFEDGFSVVLEDVVPASMLGDYRTTIRSRPCHVIVLVEAGGFADEAPRVGIWLDTTNLTPDETVDEILAQTPSTRSPIVVTNYDEEWPRLFEQLAQPVSDALADLGAEVEHVGSTAVPGLAAKPIIDIEVVVPSAAEVSTAIERLRSLGYVYQGDKGIRGREAFMWPPRARRHHLYVVVRGSRPSVEHLRFRDYLRDHPDVARDYAALKTALADRYGHDRLGYTDAKADFIAGVLRAAGES